MMVFGEQKWQPLYLLEKHPLPDPPKDTAAYLFGMDTEQFRREVGAAHVIGQWLAAVRRCADGDTVCIDGGFVQVLVQVVPA